MANPLASPLPFSTSDEGAQQYLQAQEKLMRALENRGQPNLYQVAGALARPTATGNALEALGAGSAEYGKQLSEQEKLEPSLIQMRAGLAAQKYQIEQEVSDRNVLQNYLQKKNPNLLMSVQESLSNGEPVSANDMKDLNALMPILKPGTQTHTQVKELFSQAKDIAHSNIESAQLSEQRKKNIIDALGPLTKANFQEYVDAGIYSPTYINKYFNEDLIKTRPTQVPPSELSNLFGSNLKVTSGFGDRTLNGQEQMHGGIDLAPKDGKAGQPISSPVDGQVVMAGPMQGYGKAVVVRRDDGHMVLFGHVDPAVPVGTTIKQGDVVGKIGDMLGATTGNHVEVKVLDPKGRAIDPLSYQPFTSLVKKPDTLVASTDKYPPTVQSTTSEGQGFTFRPQADTEPNAEYRKLKDEAYAKYVEHQRKLKEDELKSINAINESFEKEVNKTPEELINTVQTSGNHYTVTSNKTKINYLIDQVSSYKDVTNLMQKYGVFQPLAQLFQSGVQTPWGSLNLDMYNAKLASLPTKATRPDGTTYNPQAKAREISQLIYELNQNVMKAAKGIYGPNISNSDAIEMAKSGFKPDDPAQFIANYAAKMGVINEYNGYIASAYRKYAKTHRGAEKADFFDPDASPEYRMLVKNFDTKYSSLLNTLR